MNSNQLQKLELLLSKRKQKVESLNNFDAYFEIFSYSILKQVSKDINERLETSSNEGIRIFNEHPYENRRTRYFVMLQLISSSYKRNNFFLDNTTSFPSLLFEGDEFRGKVKSTINFEGKINSFTEHDVIHLINEDYVTEILINFLDTVYSF
jgi:hypothetical protein